MRRVVAYVRISKADAKREASLGIEAQRAAILRAAEHHEWEIVAWYSDDGVTGRHMRRPGITAALADLKAHRADGLVATKLDRLSRSTQDFAQLLDVARRQRWDVAVLDFALDTSTATGRFIAGMLAQFAQFEREVIGERTRAALVVKKAEGVPLGKPSTIPTDVQARILAAHRAGQTYSGIARALDADAVPTPGGSPRWHHSVVAGVVRRALLATPAHDAHDLPADLRDQKQRSDEPRGRLIGEDEHDDHQRNADAREHPTPDRTAHPASSHARHRTEAAPA